MTHPAPALGADALQYALSALKNSTDLYALGFNALHAESCQDGKDVTGCTRQDYDRAADEIRTQIAAAIERVRVALAAVPASEPVRLMNFGADGPAQWSGANNAYDLTKSVTTTYSNSTQIAAAPAPVSGMPDLASARIAQIDRELANMPKTWVADKLKKERAALLPSPQAPDAPVVPECEPCNGMGIQDGSGEICPKCHGEGVTHTGIDESPTIVDADGLPQAVAAILRSNGDIISLANLYALIDAWGEKQRALAARQSPAEDEFAKIMSDANVTHIACMMGNIIYNLSQKKGHMLTATDCEMFNSLRKQWDAARQAPPKLHKDYCQRCLRVHASVDCAPADLARLAPDSRDAARYRWLRDKSDPGICAFYLSVGKAFDGVKFNQGTVDCAIDAQIITQEKAQ